MSELNKLILESWLDVDNKNIRGPRDANFFSCDEAYEKEYLADVLEIKTGFSRKKIEDAIDYCCAKLHGNKPRNTFIDCVLTNLL